MPTYLYCLLTTPSDSAWSVPRGLTGIAGEAIRRLNAGGVCAWVGTVASDAFPRTLETAREHDRVVRSALVLGPALPARSGQVFPGDEACLRELERRENAIREAIRRVAGAVEMRVHVTLRPLGAPAAGDQAARTPSHRSAFGGSPGSDEATVSGRAYLEAASVRMRLERNLQAESARPREAIHAAVGGIVRDASVSLDTGDEPRLTISHLILRADVDRYRASMAAVSGLGGATIGHVAGPYPPYSFAELRDE